MNITDYGPLKETKSHFDSDFLYNTYPCSIPLDFTEVPLHWHNEMELIYIKKGCMIVSVDLEYSVVNAGDIVVVMPGHIHSIIQNESDSCEYENILFNLDMLVSRQCDYDTVSFFNGIAGFNGYCPPVISKTAPHYSDLIHYIDEADNICKYFPDGYRLKIRACLFNFFFELNAHFYTHTDMPVHLSDDKMDKLKLVAIVTHVADARSCVLHPASHTHRQMNEQELDELRIYNNEMLDKLFEMAKDYDMLVMDESVYAIKSNLLDEEKLITHLEEKPVGLEVVLAGRNPSQKLMDHADYVSEIQKVKHPFDHGVSSRVGIEL